MNTTLGSSTATDLTLLVRARSRYKQPWSVAESWRVAEMLRACSMVSPRNQQSWRVAEMRHDLMGYTAFTTEMTPGATYQKGVTATRVHDALRKQHEYARRQWATGGGVVGPTGSEQNIPFSRYNNPANQHFALYQQFGYHHDLQSADAQLQVGSNYDQANKASALRGFDVLIASSDVIWALQTAQSVWGSSGFVVRSRY
jgi:hypothetical protein